MSKEPSIEQSEIIRALREENDQLNSWAKTIMPDTRLIECQAEVQRLRAENARLAESLAEWEEKEGSCCPENTSFVTVIERLRAENARLAAALNFIFMECDWEEGKGDDRIGDACLKHRDNGKCLSDLLAPTIELLRDMLLRPQEHNPARLNRLVKELTRLRSLAGTTGRG